MSMTTIIGSRIEALSFREYSILMAISPWTFTPEPRSHRDDDTSSQSNSQRLHEKPQFQPRAPVDADLHWLLTSKPLRCPHSLFGESVLSATIFASQITPS